MTDLTLSILFSAGYAAHLRFEPLDVVIAACLGGIVTGLGQLWRTTQ
jgi:hypothetical protein